MEILHNSFPCCNRAANIVSHKPRKRTCKHCATHEHPKGRIYMVTVELATQHIRDLIQEPELYAARWERLDD